MREKQKKQLMKILISLITMLVVTVVGYYKVEFEDKTNEEILAKPRNARSII